MRKGRNLKRLRALANSSLMSSKEERCNAQNPDRKEDWKKTDSKLLNNTICPKPSSDSGPLVLMKRLCLILEGIEERG